MGRLDAAALSLLGLLATAALRATVPLAVAFVAVLCLRRRSAALRHCIWMTALFGAAALVVLPASLPAWPVLPCWSGSILSAAMAAPATGQELPAAPRTFHDDASASVSVGREFHMAVASTSVPSAWRAHAPTWLASMWCLGAMFLIAREVRARRALGLLTRTSRPLDADHMAVATTLTRAMRIRRTVTFASSDLTDVPLTWGFVSPRVMLPADWREWPDATWRHVIQHELAHVDRYDAAAQTIVHVAAALFWFHPLVWHAVRERRLECERACDDRVLHAGASAPAYADDLLAFARQYRRLLGHFAASAMATRSRLETRLAALLDPTLDRAPLSRRRLTIVQLCALLVLAPAATIRESVMAAAMPTPAAVVHVAVASTAARPQEPFPSRTPEPSAIVTTRARTETARAPIATPPVDAFEALGNCASSGSIHEDADDRLWQIRAHDGPCNLTLTAMGDVIIDPGGMTITSIAPGGSFDVTIADNGHATRLIVRPVAGGALSYDFTRDEAPLPSSGAPAWLAQTLLLIDRLDAFAVDRRVPALLASGGATAVLDEVDHMRHQHAPMVYLMRLAETSSLDADALARAAGDASRFFEDSPKTRVLLDLIRTQRVGSARRAIDAAVATIAGGRDRARVQAMLDRAARGHS